MERPISEIAFTATVKTAQQKRGSRAPTPGWNSGAIKGPGAKL